MTQVAPGAAAVVNDPAELADRVAAVVIDCRGVAGLVAGPIATYLPHRTVPGVAVRDRVIEVALIARYGTPLYALADRVRGAVRQVAPGYRVDVLVEDLAPADRDRQGTRPGDRRRPPRGR